MQVNSPFSHSVRVVVVDYDGADVLPQCTRSLAATTPDTVPVTVIDNASPVPSESLIPKELKNRIDFVKLEQNFGYAGAIKAAWNLTSEDFLVIANNDLEFTEGWLEELMKTAVESGAYAVSAVILNEGESELDGNANASLNYVLKLIPGVFTDRTKAVYPSGACFLLKKDSNCPVDPDYFLYYEDVHIGFYLRALEYPVVQCPDAVVRHTGSHSVRRANPSRIAFLQERNRLITQILFFDFPILIALSPLILIDSLFKIPECWIRGKPVLATIYAHWWVLFNIGTILTKRLKLSKNDGFSRNRILSYITGKALPNDVPGSGLINALTTGWCRLFGIRATGSDG